MKYRQGHCEANEAGQATVELAVTLPFIALLLMTVIQVAIIGRSQVALQNAVREAARACAVDVTCDAESIVRAHTDLDVDTSASIAGDVSVVGVARVPIIVPGLARFAQSFTVEASAVMRVETD